MVISKHAKFMRCLMKKYLDTYKNVKLALLQMRSTAIDTGLPSLAMLLFNR